MSFSPEAFCMAKVSSGGGGGNPNSIQTYTGTAANLCEMTFAEYEALNNAVNNTNGAHFEITLDVSALAGSTLIIKASSISTREAYGMKFMYADLFNQLCANGDIGFGSGELRVDALISYVLGEINDMTEYVEYIPTTLTIYWHPMPSES